ncbi:unnamed protein product [Rhizophagus irregularis]|nr:unnamed protein product [Rhizophagus irregularis]
MSTSKQTSEQYPGYETITSYLKERENCQENWTYYGLLLLHRDAIIASSSSNKWKKLNNFWMNSFLKEARKLIINQEIYNAMEEKVRFLFSKGRANPSLMHPDLEAELTNLINKEQIRYAKNLEIYWKEVITELNKKDSVKRKLEEEEKENLNPQSKKSRSTITLFCIVQENIHNAFAININRNKTIKTANKVAKSIYEFNIIVNPKRTKAFNWVANIEQVTLKDLKETIFSLYQFPELEKNGATLAFSCNDKKYSPQINLEFQNMLQLFVLKRNFKFTVFIETSLSFSSWTFPKVCQLYKLSEDSDPSLSVFSLFNCEFVNLDDEKSQVIIKHLMTDLNFRFKAIPIGNEASKSQYVCSYLVAIANLFENKFKICPEKNVSGLNGHGPVDFALIQVQTSRIIGITEVKDRDFQQGVAQNAVQCESALSKEAQKLDELEDDN